MIWISLRKSLPDVRLPYGFHFTVSTLSSHHLANDLVAPERMEDSDIVRPEKNVIHAKEQS